MTWRVTANLAWADARPVLEEATRGADADDRAAAYEALIACAARSGDPTVVAELLACLGRVRNERDPVRSRVLTALVGQVRPQLYRADSVPALDALVRDAIDARDCSWQTRNAVHRLVFAVLAAAAADDARALMEWALDTVERLAAWQYSSLIGAVWRGLRRGQERDVYARLGPWLRQGVERGHAQPAIAVAGALDRRAWHLPDLQDLLGQATTVKDDWAVRRAVELWLGPPRTRSDRVGQLVARDESMVTVPQVRAVVVYRRTDLLDDLVLSGRKLKGRFGTGRARWVPIIDRAAVARWTPAQAGCYADLLTQGINDTGLDRASRARLVRTLAALPDSSPATVAGWLDGDDTLLAEAALTGLGHTDRPDHALPVLLDHVHGDRARVAIYAASRCARNVAPGQLAGILTAVLAAPKVTARKEAARLLATTRPPGAVDALLDAWHRDGQHRDVRAAVATALRTRLDDDRVWPVLDAAADDERALAETLLAVAPDGVPARHRPRYAATLCRLARHPDPAVARAAYTALSGWVPWAPDAATELAAGVTDLANGATWRHAVDAAVAPAVWTSQPDLLPGIAATLLNSTRSDPDAERLRDLPARQRLDRVVDALTYRAEAARRHPVPVRRLAAALAADATFVPAAARLHATLAEPGPSLTDHLLALADLLRDLPVTAATIGDHLADDEWDPDTVAAAVDALTGRTDTTSGLIAVQLTETAGDNAGWPDLWRTRLRALRQHPAPEVRQAARTVYTAEE